MVKRVVEEVCGQGVLDGVSGQEGYGLSEWSIGFWMEYAVKWVLDGMSF